MANANAFVQPYEGRRTVAADTHGFEEVEKLRNLHGRENETLELAIRGGDASDQPHGKLDRVPSFAGRGDLHRIRGIPLLKLEIVAVARMRARLDLSFFFAGRDQLGDAIGLHHRDM